MTVVTVKSMQNTQLIVRNQGSCFLMNRDEWRIWMNELQKDRKRVELRALVTPDGLLGGLVLPETIELMNNDDCEFFELASERSIRIRRQKRQENADNKATAKHRAKYGDWQDLSLEGW